MRNKKFDKQLEDVVSTYLEDYSFEEFLENFNLDPSEVFIHLYYSGLIDDDLLESFLTSDS